MTGPVDLVGHPVPGGPRVEREGPRLEPLRAPSYGRQALDDGHVVPLHCELAARSKPGEPGANHNNNSGRIAGRRDAEEEDAGDKQGGPCESGHCSFVSLLVWVVCAEREIVALCSRKGVTTLLS